MGLLLGDGCIQAPTSKIGGHRLTIRHSMEQYDYLIHLYDLFEGFIVQPLHTSSNLDKRTGKTYHWCNLHTLSFPPVPLAPGRVLGPPPSAQPSAADYGVACLAEGKDGGPLVLRPGRPGGPPRSLGP